MTQKFRAVTWQAALLIGVVAAGCGSKSPNTPSPTTTTTTSPAAPTLAAPAPKSPVGGAEITGVRPTLEVNNAAATGTVGSVTYRFEISEAQDFPTGSRTVAIDNVAQGNGTTSVQVPVDLQPAWLYYWHARASNGTITTDYSARESLRTENKGFRNGQTIVDPLTNGQTVADERHGGHFELGANGGWQADGTSDSLDYNIPSCGSCLVEFDVTNFDRSTDPADLDLKWFSMGDGNTFDDFQAFRDHDWKMHIEKKSAEAGAVKLIWRRGCQGDDFCDNTDNRKVPVGWEPGKVYHFSVQWGGGRMSVNACELVNGRCGTTVYDATVSGEYNPPNHRIELGTRPRNETLRTARFRNFTAGPR